MDDITQPDWNKLNGVGTAAKINGAGTGTPTGTGTGTETIDDDRPGKAKDEVDIIAK